MMRKFLLLKLKLMHIKLGYIFGEIPHFPPYKESLQITRFQFIYLYYQRIWFLLTIQMKQFFRVHQNDKFCQTIHTSDSFKLSMWWLVVFLQTIRMAKISHYLNNKINNFETFSKKGFYPGVCFTCLHDCRLVWARQTAEIKYLNVLYWLAKSLFKSI